MSDDSGMITEVHNSYKRQMLGYFFAALCGNTPDKLPAAYWEISIFSYH